MTASNSISLKRGEKKKEKASRNMVRTRSQTEANAERPFVFSANAPTNPGRIRGFAFGKKANAPKKKKKKHLYGKNFDPVRSLKLTPEQQTLARYHRWLKRNPPPRLEFARYWHEGPCVPCRGRCKAGCFWYWCGCCGYGLGGMYSTCQNCEGSIQGSGRVLR